MQQGGNNPLFNVQQMQVRMPNWLSAPTPPNNNPGATQMLVNQMNRIGNVQRQDIGIDQNQQRLDIERQRAKDVADIQMQTFQAELAQKKQKQESREAFAGREGLTPMQQAAIQAGYGQDVAKSMFAKDAQPKPYTDEAKIVSDVRSGFMSPEMGQELIRKQSAGEPITPADRFKMEGDLSKRFDTNTKTFRALSDAYTSIKSIPESAIGDVALATKIMKLLDPNSVVRESELGVAMGATGMLDRLFNLAGKAVEGKFLGPKQRKEFRELADKIYSASKQEFDNISKSYTRRAKEYSLNPENVIFDYSSQVESGEKGTTPPTGFVED
jgi:hypothetical protein